MTPVSVTLPAAANNQPCVQLRIMTTDYGVPMPPPGTTNNDEWIGIDDIRIESSPLPTDRAINDIQGSGATSPFVGERVRTTGIVTGVRTGGLGFYIQAPDAEADDDPQTSEGLLIRSVPGSMVARGDLVEVTGVVSELPLSNPEGRRVTQISGGQVQIISVGNPLPAPMTLTPSDTPADGPLDALERFEGMRVRVASLLVVGPTEGTLDEANASATSTGVFFGVIDDGSAARTMREPGLDPFEPEPPGLPSCVPPSPCVPRFDGNPERIRVDSDEQVGAAALDLAAGQTVSGLVGPLNYDVNAYSIAVDPDASLSTSDQPTAAAVAEPGASQFTVASLNLQRLYDTADDPATTDVVMTDAGLERRLNKLSLLVRNVLRTPDVLGVSEAENADVLQALADRINFDAIAAGQASPAYLAYLIEGSDPGGIDVGFLVRSTRMQVRDVTQGEVGTFVDPTDGSIDPLNDRPSLILRAAFTGGDGAGFPITVIANHLQSLDDISDPAAGPRVRAKRRAQAEFLANLVQARQIGDPNERIVVLGGMNAFQFNDGLVDSFGTITGLPAPPSAVLLASPDLVDPDLVDSGSSVPPDERYSFVFDGNAQQLDHILFTQNLAGAFGGVHFGRANADFPEVLRNDPARAERAGDHDPLVAYFTPPASLSIDDVSVTEGDHGVTRARFTVTLQGPHGHDVTVRFRTEAGDPPDGATAGLDYVTNEGTLTFGPEMTTQTIVVDVIGDRLVEPDEIFTVRLSDPSPNATIERAVGTGTILNDDPEPSISIGNAEVSEGTGTASFTASLSNPSASTISVAFATADGTARQPGDYTAAAGVLEFAPGETTQTVIVQIVDDTLDEHVETFTVSLSAAVNATILDGEGIGTIRDNDRRPDASDRQRARRRAIRGRRADDVPRQVVGPVRADGQGGFPNLQPDGGGRARLRGAARYADLRPRRDRTNDRGSDPGGSQPGNPGGFPGPAVRSHERGCCRCHRDRDHRRRPTPKRTAVVS